MEQLQSHIWLTASSYMGKYLRISSYIRKPFLIYDYATAPLWISLYIRKIDFLFYQCSLYSVHFFINIFNTRGAEGGEYQQYPFTVQLTVWEDKQELV
jgi:hypothetical protein